MTPEERQVKVIELLQAIVEDAGGGELEGDYAGCVALDGGLISQAIDLLALLLAEVHPQDRAVEFTKDPQFPQFAECKPEPGK